VLVVFFGAIDLKLVSAPLQGLLSKFFDSAQNWLRVLSKIYQVALVLISSKVGFAFITDAEYAYVVSQTN